jgi:hypothetical protein
MAENPHIVDGQDYFEAYVKRRPAVSGAPAKSPLPGGKKGNN